MLSDNYKNWIAILDIKTCKPCREEHGQIFEIDEHVMNEPPLHFYCRCKIERMKAKLAGTATFKLQDGADWYLKHFGNLPDYYITATEAFRAGWNPKSGNLNLKCPGKMLIGGVHKNRNGHLPSAIGRIWYEADINYFFGFRGNDRILFSNDGLVFVTYDHYKTFIEIV